VAAPAAAGSTQLKENHVHKLIARFARLRTAAADAGMTTTEYAVGTLAAAGFAAALYKAVTSETVRAALVALIERALK
jgi:Protein of unknown function (DUF4244)